MMQHFSRKQIEDNRKKNTVNNGLTEALNLPTFPNGEIASGSMLS